MGKLKTTAVTQLQYLSLAFRAVDQQVYFETGPLQHLRDVPWRLMFLSTLITIDLMQIDGYLTLIMRNIAQALKCSGLKINLIMSYRIC